MNPISAVTTAKTALAASRARYVVLTLGFLVAGITYLDRVCISAAAPSITRELGLTDVQMGYVFSAFALAYGIFEIPMGWWGDRIGQRKALTRIVACWSAFTALTGLARSFSALITTRLLFGAAEAGAFPTLTRALARWFPTVELGSVTGVIWMGARLGGALAPPLSAMLILRYGWRATFIIFGAVGLVWCVGFWLWFRDDPAEHPAVNQAELEHIQGSRAPRAERGGAPAVPWKRLFTDSNLWALFGMYFTSAYGFWFFLTWLPTYLIREHGLTLDRSGWYSALPLTAGAAACLVGGMLSDWLVRRTGSVVWGRRAVGFGAFALGALGFGAAALATTPVAAIVCLTLAQGALDLALPVAWATCLSIGGRYGGTATGFMNTASSISAVLSPISAAWLVEIYGSFRAMFVVSFVVYVIGALLWLKIDPRRSIDPA